MKKITFLFMLLTVSLGYSQIVIEDFEGGMIPDEVGGIQGDGTEVWAQVPNPDAVPGSGNNSATVMELITKEVSAPWQNGQLYLQGDKLDLTDGNATGNKLVTVDVWSNTRTFILAKVVDGDVGGSLDPKVETATDALHGGEGWETLTFDFGVGKDGTSAANDVFGRILFFPIWNGEGWDGVVDAVPVTETLYDNIIKVDATAGLQDKQVIEFSTYPNPTRSSWTIATKNESIRSIEVFDVLGKNVLSLTPNNRTAVIDGASFKAGLYFAQVKTASGLSSLKLIRK